MDDTTDWSSFFSGFSEQIRQPLLSRLHLEGRDPLERRVLSLTPEQFDDLDRFRSDVTALSAPDSQALATVLDDIKDFELATLNRPYDLAGWLYLFKYELFAAAVELLEFDRGFNKPKMWSGFHIDAAFSNAALNVADPKFLAALSKLFASKRHPEPAIRVTPFVRSSGRSDSKAAILAISIEGALQQHRVFRAKKGKKLPVTEYFNPERGAAVLLDDKAGTIDIVATELGAAIRKAVARIALQFLGVPKAKLDRLQPRWVNVEPLAKRFLFKPDPGRDGVIRVRLVGARMSRGAGGVVSLDARDSDSDDAWIAWQAWGRSKPDTFGNVKMLGATLEFVFPDKSSTTGERVRTLRLHQPFGLIMQNWPKAHREAAEKLLDRWGFSHTGPTA